MNKVKIKAKAKINFTLDVTGVRNGFHLIKSLVCSISLADEVIIKKRNDKHITLAETGIKTGCAEFSNNAYIAAKLFRDTFDTSGVDIVIKKKIPVGGGLGGSSADICAVFNGMKKLFNINSDLTDLVSKLGSDTAFMLNGGYALLEGRGEKVKFLNVQKQFYLLILTAKTSVSARECYKEYDRVKPKKAPITLTAAEYLKNGETQKFLSSIKNDLFLPAKGLVGEIETNLFNLKEYGTAVMTGSGSAVVGIYTDKKHRNYAYAKLKDKYKGHIIKTQTEAIPF